MSQKTIRYMIMAAALAVLVSLGAASAEALCVNSTSANLRSGPGTRYELLWEVFRYMPLELRERRGVWLRTRDFAGDTYWIYESLVTDAFRCAVVKDERADVRTAPDAKAALHAMSPALKFSTFKVVTEDGEWVEVENEFGAKGWIAAGALWIN